MFRHLTSALAAALLLTACTATPLPPTIMPGALTPYFTLTPSPTFAQAPEVISGVTQALPTVTPFTYTVQEGDTLSEIAERFRVPLDVLMAANPTVSPNAMSVGLVLLIPSDVDNPTGQATATPAPFAITQVQCYPTTDGGMWCFALARNDSSEALDNLSARLSLHSTDGKLVAAQTAIPPLNLVPPHTALPLTAFFPPPVPADASARVQVLSAIIIPANDPRYLPASLTSLTIDVAADGRRARVTGQVELSAGGVAAKTVWVAAVAYDGAGRVVGFRRWEWNGELVPEGRLPFDFWVSGFGSGMMRVEVFAEARP